MDPEQTENQGPEPNTLLVNEPALQTGFTQIPNWVLRTPTISAAAKLLYGILLSYAWEKDHCYPGYDRLTSDMQCGRDALAKYIRELKTSGLLIVKRRGQGKTSLYTLNITIQKSEMSTSRSRENRLPVAGISGHEEYSIEKDSGEEYRSNRKAPPSRNLSAEAKTGETTTLPLDDITETITDYVTDFGAEFGDNARASASAARALNLWRRSGQTLGLDRFVKLMMEAREATKHNLRNVRAERKPGRPKSAMAYWFACLENLLASKATQTER